MWMCTAGRLGACVDSGRYRAMPVYCSGSSNWIVCVHWQKLKSMRHTKGPGPRIRGDEWLSADGILTQLLVVEAKSQESRTTDRSTTLTTAVLALLYFVSYEYNVFFFKSHRFITRTITVAKLLFRLGMCSCASCSARVTRSWLWDCGGFMLS